ncbi:MAG TPA: hypothetical protein VF487_15825 [Chitinophagaceae bacterium]
MKLFIFLASLFTLTVSADSCKKKKDNTVHKGKLEIKAMCMNYTIGVLDGSIDTSLIAANWTDETTGKLYQNVFRLGSPCDFPDSIKEGQEFYFIVDTMSKQGCPVCMAYYPTPSKKLMIKVVEK